MMALYLLQWVNAFLFLTVTWGLALPLHAQTRAEQVSFTVTDGKERVAIEEKFKFTAVVTNRNNQDLSGATIRITVAPYLLPDNIQPAPTSSNPEERIIIWENQIIPAQTTREFSFEALAEQGTPAGQVLTSRGEFTSESITLSASDTVQVTASPGANKLPVAVTAPTGPSPFLWLTLASILVGTTLLVLHAPLLYSRSE